MAAVSTQSAPNQDVGSSGWLAAEMLTFGTLRDQEIEEFSYTVRNELQWLNDRMEDILQSAQPMTLTQLMKTPSRTKEARSVKKTTAIKQVVSLSSLQGGAKPKFPALTELKAAGLSPKQPRFFEQQLPRLQDASILAKGVVETTQHERRTIAHQEDEIKPEILPLSAVSINEQPQLAPIARTSTIKPQDQISQATTTQPSSLFQRISMLGKPKRPTKVMPPPEKQTIRVKPAPVQIRVGVSRPTTAPSSSVAANGSHAANNHQPVNDQYESMPAIPMAQPSHQNHQQQAQSFKPSTAPERTVQDQSTTTMTKPALQRVPITKPHEPVMKTQDNVFQEIPANQQTIRPIEKPPQKSLKRKSDAQDQPQKKAKTSFLAKFGTKQYPTAPPPPAAKKPQPAGPMNTGWQTSSTIAPAMSQPISRPPLATSSLYKTPVVAQKSAQQMQQMYQLSPVVIHGENIELEEIVTSDEDDEEYIKEKRRNLPDWALTPNLNEQLMRQEKMDPDAVFGPIAPLVMEEIFLDKSRHHRFRSRTSSANWFGSDRLTVEEVQKDRAARERLRNAGQWFHGLA